MRREGTFSSEGAAISGWFYSPDPSPPWPLVAMAHGFSATERTVTDRYAEVFAGASTAVLSYDHRGFGASGGNPRRRGDPWMQARGYRDAISFATTLDDIDPSRVAAWGDSLPVPLPLDSRLG